MTGRDCLGFTKTRRATKIYPAHLIKGWAFRLIRLSSGDDKRFHRLVEWTRHWKGPWVVDLRPSGGEVVEKRFSTRESAIEYELGWLADNFDYAVHCLFPQERD